MRFTNIQCTGKQRSMQHNTMHNALHNNSKCEPIMGSAVPYNAQCASQQFNVQINRGPYDAKQCTANLPYTGELLTGLLVYTYTAYT